MEETNKTTEEVQNNKELSYEELKNMCAQLSEQSRQLYSKLQEANLFNMFKRLEYLFKVVENFAVFDAEFANSCIKEIQEMMTLKEETEEKESTQKESKEE